MPVDNSNIVTEVVRPFNLVVTPPGQLREVIQLPARWCVVEGSPLAGEHKAGETVDGDKRISRRWPSTA